MVREFGQIVYTVDFDGVLCEDIDHENIDCRYWNYYDFEDHQKNVNPIWKNIEKVNKLYNDGHRIIIFTSRFYNSKEITEKWLRQHGVQYHDIIYGKPISDFYIDSRALKPEEI